MKHNSKKETEALIIQLKIENLKKQIKINELVIDISNEGTSHLPEEDRLLIKCFVYRNLNSENLKSINEAILEKINQLNLKLILSKLSIHISS